MVLNEDSTHPNPWKPIPAFQKWWMVEYPVYQIYKKHPEKHTRGYDIFRDEDMADRLGWFIRKATIIGIKDAYGSFLLACLLTFFLHFERFGPFGV